MSFTDVKFWLFLLKIPVKYLPKEQAVSVVVPSGTEAGTELRREVTPPEGHIFLIKYFKLTTPPEVEGNILVTTIDGEEVKLINRLDNPPTYNQPENETDTLYDASDWGVMAFIVKKVTLLAHVKTTTTADREVVLKWCGSLMREPR